MQDLISWYFNIDTTNLTKIDNIFYTNYQKAYIYIIPVGKEKSTTFFHLLQLIEKSPHQRILLSRENSPTITFNNLEYYALMSDIKLHENISSVEELKFSTIYNTPYQIATHFKNKWMQKNKIHEQELNIAIDKVNPDIRSLLFDLATYYIHLNEEVYNLIKPIEQSNFFVSLCHARLKSQSYMFELFIPEMLIIDNKSRMYCEYIRDLFLRTMDSNQIRDAIISITIKDPLSIEEWNLLYTRLYLPTHFYDMIHDIINGNEIKIETLYEQTLSYTKLLAILPDYIYQNTGIKLTTPTWVANERYK